MGIHIPRLVHTYTYVHTYIRTYVHTYIHTYVYADIHTYIPETHIRALRGLCRDVKSFRRSSLLRVPIMRDTICSEVRLGSPGFEILKCSFNSKQHSMTTGIEQDLQTPPLHI